MLNHLRGNKCCEILATDFGWSRAFPLKMESDVHESLDLFLGRYGIPEVLVSNNLPRHTLPVNSGRRQSKQEYYASLLIHIVPGKTEQKAK
jgi:hypothetical protein